MSMYILFINSCQNLGFYLFIWVCFLWGTLRWNEFSVTRMVFDNLSWWDIFHTIFSCFLVSPFPALNAAISMITKLSIIHKFRNVETSFWNNRLSLSYNFARILTWESSCWTYSNSKILGRMDTSNQYRFDVNVKAKVLLLESSLGIKI